MSLVDAHGRPIAQREPNVRVLVDRTDPEFRPPQEQELAEPEPDPWHSGPVAKRGNKLPDGVHFYFDRVANVWTLRDDYLDLGENIVGWSQDKQTALRVLENYLLAIERKQKRRH